MGRLADADGVPACPRCHGTTEDNEMATAALRKIIRIDESKCNGCGECVPSCAEGAIRIVDGKAKLVAENLCDGLGACLGRCPLGAIIIEERPADAFDAQAVEEHLRRSVRPAAPSSACPGSMFRKLDVLTPALGAPSAATGGPRPASAGSAGSPGAAIARFG